MIHRLYVFLVILLGLTLGIVSFCMQVEKNGFINTTIYYLVFPAVYVFSFVLWRAAKSFSSGSKKVEEESGEEEEKQEKKEH